MLPGTAAYTFVGGGLFRGSDATGLPHPTLGLDAADGPGAEDLRATLAQPRRADVSP
jgi:hypothetical protein